MSAFEFPAPPAQPAEVLVVESGILTLHYNDAPLLTARIRVRSAGIEHAAQITKGNVASAGSFGVGLSIEETRANAIEQRVTLTAFAAATEVLLDGTVLASPEAFSAETLGPAQERFPLVRNHSGLGVNMRDNAVYDRRFDWVLIGPTNEHTRITPQTTESGNTFQFEARGATLTLIFRPRFYGQHKNLRYFEPWRYQIWPESVAGWCSWWPFFTQISQEIVAKTADVLARQLRDYGYEYVEIDDGYQAGEGLVAEGSGRTGMPETWLNTNERFPHGLTHLESLIRTYGLLPALWAGVYFTDTDVVESHPDWFIQGDDGAPHRGPWIGYAVDATNQAALDAIVRPLYRAVRAQGWRYMKVDTLRHYLYDALYPCRAALAAHGTTPEAMFRALLSAIRAELGHDTYMLACWGVLPEAIGIADGCRLGGDGFGPVTLQQYNSWNNVVWRNDPDHCDITPVGEEIIRPTLVSLAGAQLLLTDKPEVYEDDAKIAGARRAAPVLLTLPGQLYDYDPRKSDAVIAGQRNENGGADAGPIDADQWGDLCPWWLLDIHRPFESWAVLGRLSWQALPEASVRFTDLGWSATGEYLVYEFWTQHFLGVFQSEFTVPAQQPLDTRVYAIRPLLDRPQLVSTSRHVTQGGVDLSDLYWDDAACSLSGTSDVVATDNYTLKVYLPMGYSLRDATVDGTPTIAYTEGRLVTVSWTPQHSGSVAWVLACSFAW